MYHIYLDEEAVNNFACRLASAESFRDGTYTLYADVPAKCFGSTEMTYRSRKNLSVMDSHTRDQTIDFVVARGNTALLAICTELMTKKSQALLKGPLQDLSHIIVMMNDDTKTLYNQVFEETMDFLQEHAPIAAELYTLVPKALEESDEELRRRHLLQPSGNVSPYGRACGIFFRYSVSPDGSLQRQAVTSEAAYEDYLCSLRWAEALPACGEALQTLLDTPIEDFFTEDDFCRFIMDSALQEIPFLKSCSASGKIHKVRELPQLIYHLHSRATHDNEEQSELLELSGQLMGVLSRILADDTSPRTDILRMPIRSYFQQAALLDGTGYPLWLFETAIAPFLNEKQFPGAHTLQFLLKEYREIPREQPFPSLLELLVLPLAHAE